MSEGDREEGAAEPGPWLSLLEGTGALRRGHFRLSSGLHSPAYVQCALLLEDPARARQVGEALAAALVARLGEDGSGEPPIQAVISPALGGVVIGHEVAAALGVPFRFTERQEGKMVLRRGFSLEPGERVVVVEDVVTTGRSTREVVQILEGMGAEVLAVGAILDRSGGEVEFTVPFEALVTLDLPTYRPEACPLCAEGQEAEKPGSRPG